MYHFALLSLLHRTPDALCRTLSGGVITLVSSLIMFCLFVSEFSAYPPVLAVPQLLRTCTFRRCAGRMEVRT